MPVAKKNMDLVCTWKNHDNFVESRVLSVILTVVYV